MCVDLTKIDNGCDNGYVSCRYIPPSHQSIRACLCVEEQCQNGTSALFVSAC